MRFDTSYSGVSEHFFHTAKKNLREYRDFLISKRSDFAYRHPESAIALVYDDSIGGEVFETVKSVKNDRLKLCVVIGIGGSNLGALALYDALRMQKNADAMPELLFADTVSPTSILRVMRRLDSLESRDEFVTFVATKSGTTTETLANFETLYAFLRQKFGDIESRFVIATDKGSKLWDEAQGKGMTTLEIPKMVGGRYSVFSCVGLFPLALAGFGIETLMKGARDITELCLNHDGKENAALFSAAASVFHLKKKRNVSNHFFFHMELENAGKWYRQLAAESLGKELDGEGNPVRIGLVPTVSLGSVDLHSMVQRYLGGKDDILTHFVHASEQPEVRVPKSRVFETCVSGIGGKSFAEIMTAIYEGVKKAYEKNHRPYLEYTLDGINEYELGAWMQAKMIETMYTAKLLNINAFDQPQVEDYKIETKRLLLANS
ncbi:MAG: hypothetical protein HY453_01800 [Parcubacteria group bacterium]|nr:hypothetical protein [Parcubacteria group bacterium]